MRRSNCFHLAKEALRCCLTESNLPPLAGMTHFDHTQQPNNKQPICSKSDFKHLCNCYLKTGSGVLAHEPELPHLYLSHPGVLHCFFAGYKQREHMLCGPAPGFQLPLMSAKYVLLWECPASSVLTCTTTSAPW